MTNKNYLKEFYFTKFETRKPYKSLPENEARDYFFQLLAVITIALGCLYLYWRWTFSLNLEAIWFSVPLVAAETLSFVGTFLIVINYWSNKDQKKKKPVKNLSDIEPLNGREDRPLKIDVFIATYNEDAELVRYSIRDACKMKYPHKEVDVKVYVIDDGRRDGRNPEAQNMKQVAIEEGAGYFTRENNEGYKAGNLRNALAQTSGDLFVILDADTRPFEGLLENTTGYFRNHQMAWVQTPQWFYDLTESVSLKDYLISRKSGVWKALGKISGFITQRIKMQNDVFGNDPRVFYDVILRKRNLYNAAFCCGAGSIQRREAVMNLAVKTYTKNVQNKISYLKKSVKNEADLTEQINEAITAEQPRPFHYHASEDIYTSLLLHADKEKKWKSYQHPDVECKMLSPQDLDSWVKQRTRYASGSLEIAFKSNPITMGGLSLMQRLSYFTTIWSYFAPLWIIVFLLSPIIFFFTLTPPIQAFNFDFFKFFVPFLVMHTVLMAVGCWGISTKRGDQYYINSFWLMLMSLFTAISGKKVQFNVTPKDRQTGKNLVHVIPHIVIITLTVLGILYNSWLIAFNLHPSVSGFAANVFWGLFNIYNLNVIIRAAYWQPDELELSS
ncbi:MAG: glycosyltransferase [Chitinophagaceae bacterium]|nr:MAG: glycosyltransferase [Chitinophagaceae bacterium]